MAMKKTARTSIPHPSGVGEPSSAPRSRRPKPSSSQPGSPSWRSSRLRSIRGMTCR